MPVDRGIDRVSAAPAARRPAAARRGRDLGHHPFAYATVFGAPRAGLAVAPLAPDILPANLATMVADAGAKLLFLDRGVAQHLAGGGRIAVRARGADDDGDGGTTTRGLAGAGRRAAGAVAVQPDWTFSLIYCRHHRAAQGIRYRTPTAGRRCRCSGARLQHAAFGGDGPIPLYSNMTLSSFLPSLAMGRQLVLMSRFDAGRWFELAEHHRVTTACWCRCSTSACRRTPTSTAATSARSRSSPAAARPSRRRSRRRR